MSATNDLSSAGKLTRRVQDASNGLQRQLSSDVNIYSWDALKMDETTGHIKTQMAIVKLIFQDYTTGEVMLTILPLEGRAREEETYHVFENVYFYNTFTLLLPMKFQLRLAVWTDLLHCTKRFISSQLYNISQCYTLLKFSALKLSHLSMFSIVTKSSILLKQHRLNIGLSNIFWCTSKPSSPI